MKKLDIKGETKEELQKLLVEKRATLKNFKFGTAGAKTKNVKEESIAKKDIARILTALNSTK